MKPLNQLELDSLVHDLNESLKHSQLQDCTSWDDGIILWHYRQGERNLMIDLSQPSPLMLLKANEWKLNKRKKPFPIQLFINSHARNLYFDQARLLEQWGRVVELIYRNTEVQVKMQLHLIPKQANFLVETGSKKIYFSKPRELKPAQDVDLSQLEARSLVSIEKEWCQSRFPQKSTAAEVASSMKGADTSSALLTTTGPIQHGAAASARTQAEKVVGKKKKALEAIQAQLKGYDDSFWLILGEKIKVEGLDGLSVQERESLKDCRHVGEAIQLSFHKAKQIQQKRAGTLQRQQQVEDEIVKLERQIAEGILPDHLANERSSLLFKEKFKDKQLNSGNKNLKLRKLELSPTTLAFVGKSALDNLSLLRQARAWDIWLHLKDYPGAYGIIRKEKNESVQFSNLLLVARFVAKNSRAVQGLANGDRVSVVYAECRHVRPIKGAKPGFVTYQNAQEILVEIEGLS